MANVVSFLQPILIPVAIAAILAYLLDPLVTRMAAGGLGRTKSIILLFAIAGLALAVIATWVVPAIGMQSNNLVKELPQYTVKARDQIVEWIYRYARQARLVDGATEVHQQVLARHFMEERGAFWRWA